MSTLFMVNQIHVLACLAVHYYVTWLVISNCIGMSTCDVSMKYMACMYLISVNLCAARIFRLYMYLVHLEIAAEEVHLL